jgi:AcrR family transcriptional regulator
MASDISSGTDQPDVEPRGRQIIREAARLFCEFGYAGTRMTDIASAIGVTKPIVYRHYASKQAIFETWLTTTVGSKASDAAAALRTSQLPLNEMLATVIRIANETRSSGEVVSIWRIAIGEADRFPDLAEMVRRVLFMPVTEALGEVFAQGQANGQVRAGIEPRLLAELFLAPLLYRSIVEASFGGQAEGFVAAADMGSAHHEGFARAWLV